MSVGQCDRKGRFGFGGGCSVALKAAGGVFAVGQEVGWAVVVPDCLDRTHVEC